MPLIPVPPRQERPERIDSVEPSDPDFADSFGDIARVNRFLGGTRAVLAGLDDLVPALPPAPRPVRLLDLATGSADIPRALVRQARRGRFGGRPVQIVAADNHPKVLAIARRQSEGFAEITVEEADVFALPYADASFDIALCSLAFHHWGPTGCVRVLREMERVSSAGFIVNDLRRDPVACGLIWALTRLTGANRLTRHDAPLSVLRAYTVAEYEQMIRDAGISSSGADIYPGRSGGCAIRRFPMYRVLIVRRLSYP